MNKHNTLNPYNGSHTQKTIYIYIWFHLYETLEQAKTVVTEREISGFQGPEYEEGVDSKGYKRNVLYHPYDGGYTTVHICQNSLKCMLKIFELYAFHILIKLMGCSLPKMVPNTVPNWSMTFLKTFFRDTWLAQWSTSQRSTRLLILGLWFRAPC